MFRFVIFVTCMLVGSLVFHSSSKREQPAHSATISPIAQITPNLITSAAGQAVLATHLFFRSITFTGDFTGIAAGAEQRYWMTTDGGLNWNEGAIGGLRNPMPAGSFDLVSAAVGPSSNLCAIGQHEEIGSSIYSSRDGGANWKEVFFPNASLNDVTSVRDEMWIVGTIDTYGVVLHNSGEGTWVRIWRGEKSQFLAAVQFVDERAGWSAGHSGLILHTIDGGRTWAKQKALTKSNLESVAFADASNGYAVGQGGTILHSNDGGNTWEKQDSGTKANLTKAVAIDPHEAWVVGMSGTVLKTIDAGQHWEKILIGTRADVYAITSKGREVWIATSDGAIVKYPDFRVGVVQSPGALLGR